MVIRLLKADNIMDVMSLGPFDPIPINSSFLSLHDSIFRNEYKDKDDLKKKYSVIFCKNFFNFKILENCTYYHRGACMIEKFKKNTLNSVKQLLYVFLHDLS